MFNEPQSAESLQESSIETATLEKSLDPQKSIPQINGFNRFIHLLKTERQVQLITALVLLMVMIPISIFAYIFFNTKASNNLSTDRLSPTPIITMGTQPTQANQELDPTSTPLPTATKAAITKSPTAKPTGVSVAPTSGPTNTPAPTAAPTNTQAPTVTPAQAPTFNISFPTDGQNVEQSSAQLCVVEIPTGGSATMKKHKLNGGNWTEYANLYTLCFEPIEGTNIFSMQFKNSSGTESEVYTRTFNFRKI